MTIFEESLLNEEPISLPSSTKPPKKLPNSQAFSGGAVDYHTMSSSLFLLWLLTLPLLPFCA